MRDGGPAFPTNPLNFGMSLRDWYKGRALEGLLAGKAHGKYSIKAIAEACNKYADAMLAPREATEAAQEEEVNSGANL